MGVEQEFEDVLFEIEAAIIDIFGENEKLLDKQVQMAIDTLYSYYDRQKRGKKAFVARPPGLAGEVYDGIHTVCEKWMGRSIAGSETAESKTLTVSEMMRCLKRLQKSIKLWSKRGGRQGYLEYVSNFIANAMY